MGDDRVDALLYAWRHIAQAQGYKVGPLPDSIGYCFWCHEVVECYRKDWAPDTPGPTCNLPEPGDHRLCCAMPLYPLHPEHNEVVALVWASFQLGGIQAARATWVDHGKPRLATPFDEALRGG